MTAGVLDHTPVGDWLTQLLVDAMQLPVGASQSPRDSTPPYQLKQPPYLVITPIPGGTYSEGTFGMPDVAGWTVWQVDSVGVLERQARMLADRVRAFILARDAVTGEFLYGPDPDGLWITGRQCSTEAGAAHMTPAGDWPNQVWTASLRFDVYATETGAETP